MMNPILERELKTRMRTWKTPILLTVYLSLIGLVVLFFFLSEGTMSYGARNGFDPSIITTIYAVIVFWQLGLLMFILPVFTATAISGERERQTLDLLLCTDISPWKIIFGKMGAALSFVLLIVFTSLPFISIVFLFGGITLFDIIKITLFYMATAFMVSTIGIFATVHFKKNIVSIVMSYLIFGIIEFAPVFMMAMGGVLLQGLMYDSTITNFIEDYAYEFLSLLFASNPFYGMASLLSVDMFDMSYMMNNSTSFMTNIKPWMFNLVYYSVFSALFLWLSKRKLAKLK